MTDRDALLRAINLAPLDDTPRLVFADWCDENGDPDRAEFVRLQIRLDAAAGHDWRPTRDGLRRFRGGRRWDCRRERELWGRWCRRWAGLPEEYHPLEFLAASIDQYRRGFVQAVTCPTAALFGGRCGNCDGAGTIESPRFENAREPCPDCGGQWEPRDEPSDPGYSPGTGRNPSGAAAHVFRVHPITAVTPRDREPSGCDWYDERDGAAGPAALPADLYDRLWGLYPKARTSFVVMNGLRFENPAAARSALSAGCVALGRERAGLLAPAGAA